MLLFRFEKRLALQQQLRVARVPHEAREHFVAGALRDRVVRVRLVNALRAGCFVVVPRGGDPVVLRASGCDPSLAFLL